MHIPKRNVHVVIFLKHMSYSKGDLTVDNQSVREVCACEISKKDSSARRFFYLANRNYVHESMHMT